jgi:hypothetical protein
MSSSLNFRNFCNTPIQNPNFPPFSVPKSNNYHTISDKFDTFQHISKYCMTVNKWRFIEFISIT